MLTSSGIDNGDVRVCVITVSVLEVVLNVLCTALVVLGVLQEDEVLLDSLLDLGILPDVAIQDLAVEDGGVLNVDDDPFFFFLSFVASVLERQWRDEIGGRSEEFGEQS